MKIELIILIIVAVPTLWIIAFVFYTLYKRKKYVVVDTIDLTLPKSWKDLTNKQLMYICNLMLHDNTKDEILIKSFLFLTSIKVLEQFPTGTWLCQRGKERFTIQEYEIQFFAKSTSYIVDQITEITPLSVMAGYKHINPRFEGVPFKQWIAAENYYQAFMYTKEESFLNMLCAVIYSWGIEFNDSDTFKRSKKFRKVPYYMRFSVFLMYSGLKHRLSEQFTYFFQKVGIGNNQSSQKPPNMREHINNMLNVLDGGDMTKTGEILEKDSWLAFDKLNRKAREVQEIEQRLSKMKKRQ